MAAISIQAALKARYNHDGGLGEAFEYLNARKAETLGMILATVLAAYVIAIPFDMLAAFGGLSFSVFSVVWASLVLSLQAAVVYGVIGCCYPMLLLERLPFLDALVALRDDLLRNFIVRLKVQLFIALPIVSGLTLLTLFLTILFVRNFVSGVGGGPASIPLTAFAFGAAGLAFAWFVLAALQWTAASVAWHQTRVTDD